MKKSKRVNWLKVIALILTIIEIVIAIKLDKGLVKVDMNTWRLYVACIMFIPINIMFIGTKIRRRCKNVKTNTTKIFNN